MKTGPRPLTVLLAVFLGGLWLVTYMAGGLSYQKLWLLPLNLNSSFDTSFMTLDKVPNLFASIGSQPSSQPRVCGETERKCFCEEEGFVRRKAGIETVGEITKPKYLNL